MGVLTVEGWKRWFGADLEAGVLQFRRITFETTDQVVWRRVQECNGAFCMRTMSVERPILSPGSADVMIATSECGIGDSPFIRTLSVFAKKHNGALRREAA